MIRLVRPAIALAVAFLIGSTAVHAQSLAVVRIVTTPIDTGAQAFYAEDLGMFKRAGLDVQITIVGNGPSIAAAISGGTFDIGQSNVPSLAAAREHGLPFVMIAPSSIYTPLTPSTAAILVAKNSTVRSARDLNGKVIAVSGLLNIGQVTTAQWIDRNGGDSTTVKWVEMPFSEMTAALTAGRVDAVESAYPAIDTALAAGHRVLDAGYEATAKEFAIGAWFCTADYAKTHPDVVRRFVAVMGESARWANAHHAESAAILEKWTKAVVPPGMPRVYYGDHVSAAQVQPIIDVSVKYHALTAPLAASDLIAPEVLQK
jgi:NitT/TauT family transport system substrate-binding protein